MPRWDPNPIWQGEDAYVVGGGNSLRHFDWGLIRGRNTIGCNSAYVLGPEIIKIVLFGDSRWWEEIGHKGTESYGGLVVSCSPRLVHSKCPWLLTMERHEKVGLGKTKLGWHGNTGAAAINLALILGAKRVFLLGFDMRMGEGHKPNWHDLRYEKGKPEVYNRFVHEMRHIPRTLPETFPGCEIINVTDDSELNLFPKVSIAEHFGIVKESVA